MNGPDRVEHNYYSLLEVAPDAPQNEIHAAFQRAKETYGTDSPALYSMFTPEEAKELMKLIEEAFSVLGNQSSRAQYDQRLRSTNRALNFAEHSLMAKPSPAQNQFIEPQTSIEDSGYDMAIPEAEATSAVDEPIASAASQAEAFPGDPFADFRGTPDTTSVSASSQQENLEKTNETMTTALDVKSPAEGPIDVKKEVAREMGRTLISTFPIDQEMELEISQQKTFDGTFFKKVREYKQISLAKMSDHTRVGRHYMTAIEDNDFLSLPAPVFVRGFIMHIARVLGLDQKVAAASYMKLYKDTIKK